MISFSVESDLRNFSIEHTCLERGELSSSQLLCGLRDIWVSGISAGFGHCPAAPKDWSKKQVIKTWK